MFEASAARRYVSVPPGWMFAAGAVEGALVTLVIPPLTCCLVPTPVVRLTVVVVTRFPGDAVAAVPALVDVVAAGPTVVSVPTAEVVVLASDAVEEVVVADTEDF